MGKKKKEIQNKILGNLLYITETLNHIKDIDSLLDRILFEARNITNADAGSIYLVSEDKLKFSYVQNDTLASRDKANNRYIYTTHEMPINDRSIAGYVALTGKSLIIDDAYKLDDSVSYSFNKSFDEKASYRTKSILTVPLKTSRDKVIGVIQIINAMGRPEKGKKAGRKTIRKERLSTFTKSDEMYVTFFANNASVAIERAVMTREIILRMIRMAELRDPKETGNHVNRVGSYAIEIFEQWGRNRKLPQGEIKRAKDTLRIAAMLHDVGKVAISDNILKKPARLTEEEYAVMRTHTVHGALLFGESVSDWDSMSAEIALNHHERWDGKGYPGEIVPDMEIKSLSEAAGKTGADIPITARIVALADVYDALISKRVYKDAWDEDKVLAYIKEEAGKQFDPEVVEAFFEIYPVISAIRDKYSD